MKIKHFYNIENGQWYNTESVIGLIGKVNEFIGDYLLGEEGFPQDAWSISHLRDEDYVYLSFPYGPAFVHGRPLRVRMGMACHMIDHLLCQTRDWHWLKVAVKHSILDTARAVFLIPNRDLNPTE